jgi:hypothetical protein
MHLTTRSTAATALAAVFLAFLAPTASSQGLPRRPTPLRKDIVASFTSGASALSIKVEDKTEAHAANVIAGYVVLSTDNVDCRPTATRPCRYTLAELNLWFSDFKTHDQDVTGFRVRLARPIAGLKDYGAGIEMPLDSALIASGSVGGDSVEAAGSPQDDRGLDLILDLNTQRLSIAGRLEARSGNISLNADLLATSLSPFTNLPPQANAGPDFAVTTSCFAEVSLTPQSTDPNGGALSHFYSEGGLDIGSGKVPVKMFPGRHDVRLLTRDDYYSQDDDWVTAQVIDDGATAAPPGTTLVSFQAPSASSFEKIALLAEDELKISDRVQVQAPGAALTEVVNFGPSGSAIKSFFHASSVTRATVWSRPKGWLLDRSTIGGSLYTETTPERQTGTTVSGGISIGEYWTNPDTLSFVLPPAFAQVAVGSIEPGQTKVLSPGEYGTVSVKSRATLRLEAGQYRFTRLEMEPESRLELLGASPTIVVADQAATLRGGTFAPPGGGIVLVSLGTSEVIVTSPFVGTVLAPQGKITINSSNRTKHIGAFFAKNLQVDSDAIVEHAAVGIEMLTAGREACALTPVLECVASREGVLYARFSYDNAVDYYAADVPHGLSNRIVPGATAQGQPEIFFPGYQLRSGRRPFEVPLGSSGQVTWVLGAKSVTATPATPRCP